ncbi:MAG: RNA polymerase sigma-70 factor [Chitinophagaceae bacterium]
MGAALILDKELRSIRMEVQSDTITGLLAKKDEATFEQVFKTNFKSLHAYAFTILKDEAEAEEIVQQVFFKLWERSDTLSITGSVTAYLYRAVHNESLNFIKHLKVRSNHRLHVVHSMKNEADHASKKLSSKELETKLHSALNELPEQCRTIFQMSRFEEMKYREIADQLNISVKTVENQMGKALKLLRVKLVEFLVFLIVLFNI